MKITITATITDEQCLLLAKEKWYEETITNIIDPENNIIETIPNPITPSEFVKNVYEAMLMEDATQTFIRVTDRELDKQRALELASIRDTIVSSITSSIE